MHRFNVKGTQISHSLKGKWWQRDEHNDWVATTQAIRWWAALFFLSALVLPLEFLGQIWAVFLVFLAWMVGLFAGFFVGWRHNVRAGRVFGPKAARVLELPIWFFLFVLLIGVLVVGRTLGMGR